MQISYYFTLTKIQKLQNLKNSNNNKKKLFFCTGRYARYFYTGVFFTSLSLPLNKVDLIKNQVLVELNIKMYNQFGSPSLLLSKG